MFRLLLAASLAAALPQNFNPTSTSIDLSPSLEAPEVGATLEACAPRTPGAGPPTLPDNADAFVANPAYAQLAEAASAPEGYTEVFENLQGSNVQLDDYLQFVTLASYSPELCQQTCDETEDCTAFNLYFERNPVVEPAAACPDPLSTASIKCALYSASISAATATNFGQYREDFEVVIAGSNGYVKNAVPSPTPNPEDPTPNPEDPKPNPEDPTPSPEDPTPTPNPEDPQPNPANPTPTPEDPEQTPNPKVPQPGKPGPELPHPSVPTPDEPGSDAPTYGDAPKYGAAPKAPSCRAVYH